MPTSAANKFQDYVEQEAKAVHNWSAHVFKIVLSNTAPVATNTLLSDIVQIAASGGYTAGAGGGYTLASVVLSETGGVAKLVIADLTITAIGGAIGPFRYAVMYNDSATSPADALILWYDYGSAITLADTESLVLDFDGTNGVWTKT